MENSPNGPETRRLFVVMLVCVALAAASAFSRPTDGAAPDSLEPGEMIEQLAPVPPRVQRSGTGLHDDEAAGIKRIRYPHSVTLSPLHAAVLLSLEASYERMLTHHVGVVGTLGAGTIPSLFGALRVRPGLDLHEVGAQVRWYPWRQERWNPHVGVEGFWGRAAYRQDLSDDDSWLALDFSGVWTAWGGGPFVGTKYIGYGGVVVEVQAGAQVLRIADDHGHINHQVWPIVNVNVGKGF